MLFEPLFAHADKQPHQIGVIDDRGQYTYQQLAATAAGVAMYLSDQTRQPQVGLLLPASAGYVASFYGTLLAGKSVVPLNYLLGEGELARIVQDSGIDTVVTIAPLAAKLQDVPLKVIDLAQLPSAAPGVLPLHMPSPRPDDLAVLIYTSGTSGKPKGVMLTYGNLQSDVDACIEWANLQSRHHFLGIIPLFHTFGMTAMMLAPVQLGALVVYLARFSPAATVSAIREHQASIVFGIPSMFGALTHVKSATADDFKSIYAIISGGEPLPQALQQSFQERFGQCIYEGYGLTETSPVVALNVPRSHRPGSVGKPLPNVQARVVDESGAALPPGQTGELWLKGPMIMKGYYHQEEETAAALTADGFFKTGDLACLDADGFLHITGRKKDMIIVAGEKVYPREIEEVLLAHPAVAEAAVVGQQDVLRGESVAAFVLLRQGQSIQSEQLRDFCRQQGLPPWKCPKQIILADELPRSPTGKVLKRMLAEKLNGPSHRI